MPFICRITTIGPGEEKQVSDRPVPVGALLRAAAPDRLPETVAEQLRHHFAAEHVEVLVADLSLRRLAPLLGRPGADPDPDALRCLGSQQPATEIDRDGRARMHLPLSCWGDRLGVLRVVLPGRPDPEHVEHLRLVADELAVAMHAAGRMTDRYRTA